MAVGFTPKYIENLSLDNLTHQQFLVIAIETAKKLEWDIRYTSETGLIAVTNKGAFKWKAKVTIKIEDDLANLKSESIGGEMIDFGRNKKAILGFRDAFDETKNIFTTEELAQKYEELKPSFVSPEHDILTQPPPTTSQQIGSIFSLFMPREGYYITPILMDINVIVFILMVISGAGFLQPDNESLIKWGANFRPVTLEGQWWRLITNIFVHIGIMHLLLNMYALLFIGLLLEPYLGKAKFATAYFLTGIVASLTSLYLHDLTISAGASGAIFGLYGVFLAMLTTNFIDKAQRKPLLMSIGIFVVYNLMYGMKGGIDNAAHIGGLISGLIMGYCFYPSLKKPGSTNMEYSTIALLAVLIISTSFIVYKKIPNDIVKYEKKMDTFASMENSALFFYRLPKNSSKEKYLSALRDSGIYYWNKNIELLNEVEKLKIPTSLKGRAEILTNYCNLRINSYNFIYKAINEDNSNYQDSIAYYNKQIKATIDSLKAK